MTSSVFLIVVDNPAHRVLFNRYLQATPHHLVYATDGEEGFDRYVEVKPDLVIIDVDVSKLDGTIVCQLIRQQPRGEDTPIILLAGGDRRHDLEWARSVGADSLLEIPFERAALLSQIAPLLTAGRPKPPVPTPEMERPTASDDTDVLGPLVDFPTPLNQATPRAPSGEHDMDTVVSFQNPFYEANGVALVDPAIGDQEPPTPPSAMLFTEAPPPATTPTPVPEDSTEFIPRERPPSRAPTPIDDRSPPSGVPIAQSIDAGLDAPPAPDPLEEPRIQGDIRSNPGVSKSALIEEVPRDSTPSSSGGQRISAIRQRASGKERRGLDESQLGKRLAKRVRKMHGMLEEVDYYQLLGLERDATQTLLQGAYFDLSLEFHPDRFFLLRSGDLKEKIYAIYRRIHEAYRVLSDPRRRESYDQTLADRSSKRASLDIRSEPETTGVRPRPAKTLTVEATTTQGAPLVDGARLAFELGDYNAARLHLSLAKSYESDNTSLMTALKFVETHLTPTV